MAWSGFECNWLGCGSTNCNIWMIAPDEVDMEHEVVKCGMCMVNEVNILKRGNEWLNKEVYSPYSL